MFRQTQQKIKQFYEVVKITDHYITKSEWAAYQFSECYHNLRKLPFSFLLFHHFFREYQRVEKVGYNFAYIQAEKSKNHALFHNIKGYSLDEQQQLAVITEEKNNLILAGAGSGKSLTIVGKIKYLVCAKKIKSEEILVVTFTREAVASLQKSIEQELKHPFKVFTFHQFALQILKSNQPVKIAPSNSLVKIVDHYFQEAFLSEFFQKLWIKYCFYYSQATNPESIYSAYSNQGKILTTSYEEMFLCNYFYLNSISYQRKQITYQEIQFSTFYFSLTDCYLQLYFPAIQSLEQIACIREYHSQNYHHVYELFPSFFTDGTIEKKLLEFFEQYQIETKEQTGDEVWKTLLSSFLNVTNQMKQVIVTFIELMKANYYHLVDFDTFFKQNEKEGNYFKREKQQILLTITRECYLLYQYHLYQQQVFDFNDLIEGAIRIIQEKGVNRKYRYIIVDEYQDTSYTRYLLLHELQKQTGAKVIAVGDDWQSIYRFTGCNLDIFLKFADYFGDTAELKIETTYRNSQELIDIAGTFVMKNPNQRKKQLKSNQRLSQPLVIFFYDRNKKIVFEEILETINQETYTHVFLLGRTHHDFEFLSQISTTYREQNKLQFTKCPNILFEIHTIHTSKGLEADAIVLLNMENASQGFPSQMIDDPLFSFLTKEIRYYPYEEERRLFYVALTRAKQHCYFLVPRKNPSVFYQELQKEYRNYMIFPQKKDD